MGHRLAPLKVLAIGMQASGKTKRRRSGDRMVREVTVSLRSLRLEDLKIGVHSHEKISGTLCLVSVQVKLAASASEVVDDITHTVDYADMQKYILGFAYKKSYDLIEALASDLGASLLARYTKATSVTVSVQKPAALVNGMAEASATCSR